jgi:3-hydroxy-3-methylglutaryl CoA synthase/uncharacterized OB-fold protein
MSGYGIRAYAAYIPQHRLSLAEIGKTLGSGGGRGQRIVASFDEDSTTMAVEAGRAALSTIGGAPAAQGTSLYFATTSPAYLDKTNAAAIHVALGLDGAGFAADFAGSGRSGIAALRTAAAAGGLALLADVRVGQPGSGDEHTGGDGAAAVLFGPGEDVLATMLAQVSLTAEMLDRWRSPAWAHAEVWEERFGFEAYASLIRRVAATALAEAGLTRADHVVVTSPNAGIAKKSASLVSGVLSTSGSPIGHAGAADSGVALAAVLDIAEPDQTILLLSAVDGCDALMLQTTDLLPARRQRIPVATQLDAGRPVPYATYLSWRGLLVREAPRRPEPDRPAGPPSARGEHWKFAFTGSACTACGFVHLPPARVCHRCGAIDEMESVSRAEATGRIATYTVDRLAFSPSPPLVSAVIDFDDGGRYALEVADADPAALQVGNRVGLTFRCLFTAGGVHNYFWKARLLRAEAGHTQAELTEAPLVEAGRA